MDDAIGHVMMSYQWADQAIVKDIRDILRAQVIILIIKVFLKRKVLSLETILNGTHTHMHAYMYTCTHTHTHTYRGTHPHKRSDYTKLNIHSLKPAANAWETWNG